MLLKRLKRKATEEESESVKEVRTVVLILKGLILIGLGLIGLYRGLH